MLPVNSYKSFDHFNVGPMERKKSVSYVGPSYLLPMCANWSKARAYTNRSTSKAKRAPDSLVTVTKLRPRKGHTATPRYHFSGKSKGLQALVPSKVASTDAKRRLTSACERVREHAGLQGKSVATAKRSAFSSLIKAKRTRKSSSKKRRNTNSLNKVTSSLHEVIDSLRDELKETIKISKCLVAKAMKLSRRLQIEDGSPEAY